MLTLHVVQARLGYGIDYMKFADQEGLVLYLLTRGLTDDDIVKALEGLVPRFRNNVMVFGPVLLPQWEALRWSLRSLSPKAVSQAWSPTELPPCIPIDFLDTG